MSVRKSKVVKVNISAGTYKDEAEAVKEANAIKRWLIRHCEKNGYSVKGIVGVSTNSAYAGTIKRKGSKKEYVPNGMPIPTVVEAHIHMVLFANPASTIVSDLKDYLNKKHMKVVAWDKHCNTREAVENGVNYAMRQSRKIRTIDYDRKDVLSVDEWGYYEAVERAEAEIKSNMAFTKSEPEQTPETLENKSVSSISDTPETLTYKSIKYNYSYYYIVSTAYNHSIIKALLQNIIYYSRKSSRRCCSKIIFKKVLLKVPHLLKNVKLYVIIIVYDERTDDIKRNYNMMKKPIYKKWWFWTIIISILLLTIIVPFVINESYKTGQGYITLWDASDVLAYFGTALSFAGTVILGALTFWQNEKLREANDKLLNLERKSKRGYFVPEHNIKAEGFPRPIARPHYIEKQGISLICCGEDNVYVSKSVYILNGRSVENDYGIFVTTEGDFKKIFVPIELNDEERKLDEIKIDIVLYLENSRAYRYTQTLYLTFKKQKDTAYELCGFNSKFADDEV